MSIRVQCELCTLLDAQGRAAFAEVGRQWSSSSTLCRTTHRRTAAGRFYPQRAQGQEQLRSGPARCQYRRLRFRGRDACYAEQSGAAQRPEPPLDALSARGVKNTEQQVEWNRLGCFSPDSVIPQAAPTYAVGLVAAGGEDSPGNAERQHGGKPAARGRTERACAAASAGVGPLRALPT